MNMAKTNSFFNYDILILSILKNKECYGYEIIKLISSVSNNLVTIKEGTLYPILHNLLKKGYIKGRDEIVNKKVRVYYSIELTGIDYLEHTIDEFKKSLEGVNTIIKFGEQNKIG